MKVIKKLICFLMVFVSMGAFSACKKVDPDNSANNTDPEINQGGGNQEVYVSYTAGEIMTVGSEFIYEFFDSVDEGGFGESIEDINLLKMKVLFLNASKMLKEISDFNDLINGYTYFGNELDLDDECETPNSVVRFYYAFGVEDGNGDSNVKIRIVFGYDDEDADNTYSYDYYDFLIKTNKKSNAISCEVLIERSVIDGENDSTGKYFCAELNGNIGSGESANYHCYQFLRTEEILENEQANFNNIDELEQAKFDGVNRTYMGVTESKKALMKGDSEQSELVKKNVGTLGQRKRMMVKSVALDYLSDVSDKLVVYVNAEEEII